MSGKNQDDYESAGVAEPTLSGNLLPKIGTDRKMSMTHRGDQKGNLAMFNNIKTIDEGINESRQDVMSHPAQAVT